MDRKNFTRPYGSIRRTPRGYDAFVPERLPRYTVLNPDLVFLLSQADRALGELAGMARTLPNAQLLIAPLSQREAVLSSRIEGTQASLSDLAIYQAAGESRAAPEMPSDVLEVFNYRETMKYGLQRIEEFPLSLRFVRELHERLMAGVRGQEKTPGAFRQSQNWIGSPGSRIDDATYVPPPPEELMACLSDWERFLNEETRIPPLVQCALMHYQFEAIHPFLDGNGRVGRLLIVLFLYSSGHLPSPVLYLSPFFERHRAEYYEHLRGVTERGDWNSWLEFFLRGVIIQCRDAFVRSARLLRFHEESRILLVQHRAPPSAHKLLEEIFLNPATTPAMAAERMSMTVMSATRAIQALAERNIIEEVTGRRRDRVFVARRLLHAIEADSGVEE
jgi:Fic family protein